jgi:hypothetical protein
VHCGPWEVVGEGRRSNGGGPVLGLQAVRRPVGCGGPLPGLRRLFPKPPEEEQDGEGVEEVTVQEAAAQDNNSPGRGMTTP